MKILLLSDCFTDLCCSLARGLSRLDDRPEVMAYLPGAFRDIDAGPEGLQARAQQLAGERVRLITEPRLRVRDPRYLLQFASLLAQFRRFRPDVIHLQEFYADGWWRRMVGCLSGIPLVLTVHDP